MFWGELLSLFLIFTPSLWSHRLRLFFHDLGFGSFICFLRKKESPFSFLFIKRLYFSVISQILLDCFALDFEDLLFVLTCKPVVLCFVKSFLFWSMWLLRKLYLRILYLNLVSFLWVFFVHVCEFLWLFTDRFSFWFWWVR